MTVLIIKAILQIFGMFAIGWIARYLNYIKEHEIPRYSQFIIDILYPILIFHSIVSNFEVEQLPQLWMLPFLGFGAVLFGGITGIVLRKGVKTDNENIRKTFHHFCAISNYGFLPILILGDLWGGPAIAKLFFFNLGTEIGFWTIGIGTLSGKIKGEVKNLISPNIIVLIFALTITLSGLSRFIPDIVLQITDRASVVPVPLMLILVGAGMYPFPKMLQKRDLAYLSFVRLILLPACLILIIYFLPIPMETKKIPYIVALMPVPVSSSIMTHRFGGDADFAARGAVVTTILSIITIPLSLLLLTWIGVW